MALDAGLAGWQDAVARVGATLLAFEDDPTVVLLDAAALAGRTEARWRDGRAVMATIYIRYQALGDVLERATAASGTERSALLTGRSVVLDGPALGVADRHLLDASRRLTRAAPGDVLAAMTADFDAVRATVAEIAAIWADALPRLEAARRRAPDRPEVVALGQLAAADPLAFDPRLLDELDARVAAEAELRDGLAPSLAAARRALADADAVGREARAAAASVAVQVVDDRPPAADDDGDLAAGLDAVGALATAGAWSEAAERLSAWRTEVAAAVAGAMASLAASGALLAARDELRGRLRAYEAKADRTARLEDRDVTSARRDAAAVLARRPVDLAVAGALVARYQQLVNTVPPAGPRR